MGLLDQWNKPQQSISEIIADVIDNQKTITIKYQKFDGDYSERKISNIQYNNEYESEGFHNDHIKGYCHLRNEERTFKISRILSVNID